MCILYIMRYGTAKMATPQKKANDHALYFLSKINQNPSVTEQDLLLARSTTKPVANNRQMILLL